MTPKRKCEGVYFVADMFLFQFINLTVFSSYCKQGIFSMAKIETMEVHEVLQSEVMIAKQSSMHQN
jgi:hypothetical protein